MKVLVIDDNKLIGLMVKELICNYTPECDLVTDSFKGVQTYIDSIVLHEQYDLVLIDIVMPKYSGYDILKQIRNFEKHYDVTNKATIIMTSNLESTSFYADKAIGLGADGFLNKPIDVKELEALLINNGLVTEEDSILL